MLSLRAYSKLSPATGLEEPVGVHALGDQHAGYQAGQPSSQPPIMVVDGVESEYEHPQAIGAVKKRDEKPHPVGLFPLDRHVSLEGAAGQRSVDRPRAPISSRSPGSGTRVIWS